MLPSGARLAHAKLVPAHSCPIHSPSLVGCGGDDWSDDDSYGSGGSDVDVAAAFASFELVEVAIGAKIEPAWYDGSLASMVAINGEECIICLQPLITGQPDLREPAGVGPNAWVVACANQHAFHKRCIERWNRQSTQCPECSTPLLLGVAAPPQPPQPPLNEILRAIQQAKDAPTPAEANAPGRKAQEALQEERAVRQAQKKALAKARRQAKPSRRELARRADRARKRRDAEALLEETLIVDIWHARH